MKTRIVGFCLALGLLAAAPVWAGTVKEYSADMVDVKTNHLMQKLYITEHAMRVEAYGGAAVQPASASILRMDQKKMYVLMMQTKTYFEVPFDGSLKSLEDLAGAMMLGKVDVKREKQGTETVNGYTAEKFKITTTMNVNGKPESVVTYDWQASEFEPMPIRMEVPQAKSVSEMRNIKKGAPSADLFGVPADYKRDTAMEKVMQKSRKQ